MTWCGGDDTGPALFAFRLRNSDRATPATSDSKFCHKNFIMAPLLPQIYLETSQQVVSDIRRLSRHSSNTVRAMERLNTVLDLLKSLIAATILKNTEKKLRDLIVDESRTRTDTRESPGEPEYCQNTRVPGA